MQVQRAVVPGSADPKKAEMVFAARMKVVVQKDDSSRDVVVGKVTVRSNNWFQTKNH